LKHKNTTPGVVVHISASSRKQAQDSSPVSVVPNTII